MFNVTVLKMKDIKKYVIGLLATVVVVIIISKYFPQTAKEGKMIPKITVENSMLGCLDQTVPTIANMNEEYKKIAKEEDELTEDTFLQGILKTQVSSIKGLEIVEEKKKIAKEEGLPTQQEEKKTQMPQTDVLTQVVTNNPLKENYNVQIR